MGDPHSVCTESAGADNTPAPSVPHTDDTSTSVTSTDPPNANTIKGIWYPDWLVSSQRLVMFESLTVKVNLTICIWLNNHSAPTSEETESTKPRIWTSYYKSSSVCLFVCLSVCLFVPYLLRGPLTDLRQTWWVYVGGPRNCPWGVLFRKGQRLDGSTGHFHFPLYYICTSLMPHAATAPLACSCRV